MEVAEIAWFDKLTMSALILSLSKDACSAVKRRFRRSGGVS